MSLSEAPAQKKKPSKAKLLSPNMVSLKVGNVRVTNDRYTELDEQQLKRVEAEAEARGVRLDIQRGDEK